MYTYPLLSIDLPPRHLGLPSPLYPVDLQLKEQNLRMRLGNEYTRFPQTKHGVIKPARLSFFGIFLDCQ